MSVSATHAMTRVIDELVWVLRREGFGVATSQAIEVARAVRAVGISERAPLREAIASVVVTRRGDRVAFDAAFDAFFASSRAGRATLWQRLDARGFTDAEQSHLRELLSQLAGADAGAFVRLGVLLERGPELDRLLQLAGVSRTLEQIQSPLQSGFFAHRVMQQVEAPRAYQSLAILRSRLIDALGDRGELLADALKEELGRVYDDVRTHVARRLESRALEDRQAGSRGAESAAFATLSEDEIADVTRAVRSLVERLRGGERVRRRRAARGRIDPHRTLRAAMRTGAAPFSLLRTRRHRDKPRLVLLCDVSDSVRAAARFMLEFVHAAHELFERTRSFVFVSELGETTALFSRESPSIALGHAYGGSVVSVHSNSNYGRILREFRQRHLRDLDRRTTVVILGDGRTNFHDDAADVLDDIRSRAAALLWLTPESRAQWATGDSAMHRYAPRCSAVLEVRCARELERAARLLLLRR